MSDFNAIMPARYAQRGRHTKSRSIIRSKSSAAANQPERRTFHPRVEPVSVCGRNDVKFLVNRVSGQSPARLTAFHYDCFCKGRRNEKKKRTGDKQLAAQLRQKVQIHKVF